MGIPDETSWECEECGMFNIQNGRIINGHMYCGDCYKEKIENKEGLR